MPNISIDIDSFSSGQIDSKIWLCENLEKLSSLYRTKPTIWVYGGWYGILSFLLLSRNNFQLKQIRSFDIDPNCETVADTINGTWVWKQWTFKAFTEDCNRIIHNNMQYGEPPDIVINTSSEHFQTMDWFYNIPIGKLVIIQSNNMPHDDHYSCVTSLNEMTEKYPLSSVLYKGQLDFTYPDWSFSRFMIIGRR